ncbi:MAG: alpha-L-fucosidase [Planctomycetota bacterium]|jgi:alpha-L-fucosidase
MHILCLTLVLTVTTILICPAVSQAQSPGKDWYANTFFNIHFDHHVVTRYTKLGAGSDPQHIIDTLKISRPDFVQYHSKGHPGWATYPTKVGKAAPLKRDILRAWRDATNKLGIPFTVYYSGGLDYRVAEEHPQWARKKPDGKHQRGFFNTKHTSLCYNSPYVEEQVISMVREIIANYDVDGFWFDGEVWSVLPCWCQYCKAGFKTETAKDLPPQDGNHPDWRRFLQFQRDSFTRYCRRVADVIHSAKPACQFASNWAYTLRQPEQVPEFVDCLSGDPPPAHGLAKGAIEARFLATRGKPFDMVTWNQAYEFGKDYPPQPKSAQHLMQEAAMVISNGGRFMVWNNPRSNDGSLIRNDHVTIGQVRDFVYARKRWCHQTESAPDIAVLHSESHHYSTGNGLFDYGVCLDPLRGAHMALAESQHHFDLINEATLLKRIDEYRVVIVPEQQNLPQPVMTAIETYVSNGGHLLFAGTVINQRWQKLLGITPGEIYPHKNLYLTLESQSFRVPQAVLVVQPGENTKTIFEVCDADEAARVKNKAPVVLLHHYGKSRSAYIAFDAFSEYYLHRYPLMRKFIAATLNKLSPQPRVIAEAPSQVELTLRRKEGRLIVNLFNHAVGKDMQSPNYFVEDIPRVRDITVHLLADARPKRVFLFPDPPQVEWEYSNKKITVRVPELHIHRAIVIEPGVKEKVSGK